MSGKPDLIVISPPEVSFFRHTFNIIHLHIWWNGYEQSLESAAQGSNSGCAILYSTGTSYHFEVIIASIFHPANIYWEPSVHLVLCTNIVLGLLWGLNEINISRVLLYLLSYWLNKYLLSFLLQLPYLFSLGGNPRLGGLYVPAFCYLQHWEPVVGIF